MADLAAIREGLRARLDTVPDLQASAYLLAKPTPPTAMVGGPDTIGFLEEFGGTPTWTLPIILYTGLAHDVAAQKRLDTYLAPFGPTSVRAAVEADPTLGGIVDSLAVTGMTGYRTYIMEANVLYLGAELTVEIFD
ncbi:MAG: hypothetical protein M3O70_18335 [Actinomycetota bacterium]|nr:hypothetical protein [Actinomycetota bacterium]